jgi:hypothetical protein
MAQLEQAERIVYIAKNLESGLSNINAHVMKPNGSLVGPFPLVEYTNPLFAGFYYFDFFTTSNDPLGTYVGVVNSQDEQHRWPFKITYEEISVEELGDIVEEVSKVLAQVNRVDIDVQVENMEEVEVEVAPE